jgi:UPF0176 protein
MKHILFYRYVAIPDPERLRQEIFERCSGLGLKGTVLIAAEGINGGLSGDEKPLDSFRDSLAAYDYFSGMVFKETPASNHTYNKLFVRVRNEIITSRFGSRLENRGMYLEPKQLRQWLEDGEDIILVDARNDYEYEVGKFKSALTLPLEHFQQWPTAVEKLNPLKDKKIVTYCTGGIRCEKASAYLKEHGFDQVYQLHGGVLQYGREAGTRFWQGKLFMFDSRLAIDIDPEDPSKPITECISCGTKSADYHHCKNEECDKLFIACSDCFEKHEGKCSEQC